VKRRTVGHAHKGWMVVFSGLGVLCAWRVSSCCAGRRDAASCIPWTGL